MSTTKYQVPGLLLHPCLEQVAAFIRRRHLVQRLQTLPDFHLCSIRLELDRISQKALQIVSQDAAATRDSY